MILCVTGPMAAGKNAACSILEEKGFLSIDADLAGHTAAENAKKKIVMEFAPLAEKKGIRLLTKDGSLDRRALGSLIFSSADLVAKQEAIVYPEISRIIEDFMEANKKRDLVVNATLLYKLPLIKKMQAVLYIDAPLLQRFLRAKKRDGMKSRQILDRFRRQKNLFANYKKCNADIVRVWNTGTRQNLEKKIEKFLAECRQGINVWNKKEHFGF